MPLLEMLHLFPRFVATSVIGIAMGSCHFRSCYFTQCGAVFLHIYFCWDLLATPDLHFFTMASFRLPRPPRKRKKANAPTLPSSSATASGGLVSADDFVQPRVPRYGRSFGVGGLQPVLAVASGQYIQLSSNPIPPVLGTASTFAPAGPDGLEDETLPLFLPSVPSDNVNISASSEPGSKYRRKREKQWLKWAGETIPKMLIPYQHLLRETNSFRDRHPFPSQLPCTCGVPIVTKLKVVCVYFERTCFLQRFRCSC